MRKVFIITMLGEPFPWIDKYIENVQHLKSKGWYWKIFTKAKIESKGNVEIIDMGAQELADLIDEKLGVRPNLYVTEKGVPSIHVTDFYVAGGVIFEDYLKEADFWGITNLDVVYGRLDHFFPDHMLERCDVFTDDIGSTFNGVFSLMRNCAKVNTLFKLIPNWKDVFTIEPCPRCTNKGEEHTLMGTDEYGMTDVLNDLETRRFLVIKNPEYYSTHSHDRLEIHVPTPKLEIKSDNSLYELIADVAPPQWIHARPFVGREIPYFHFCKTKKWPLCLN